MAFAGTSRGNCYIQCRGRRELSGAPLRTPVRAPIVNGCFREISKLDGVFTFANQEEPIPVETPRTRYFELIASKINVGAAVMHKAAATSGWFVV